VAGHVVGFAYEDGGVHQFPDQNHSENLGDLNCCLHYSLVELGDYALVQISVRNAWKEVENQSLIQNYQVGSLVGQKILTNTPSYRSQKVVEKKLKFSGGYPACTSLPSCQRLVRESCASFSSPSSFSLATVPLHPPEEHT
jgi:hypothetical protein